MFFDNLVKKLNFISERVPKNIWPNIYWFQHENNYLYHPGCANRQFLQNREFCGDPRYLDGICTGRFVFEKHSIKSTIGVIILHMGNMNIVHFSNLFYLVKEKFRLPHPSVYIVAKFLKKRLKNLDSIDPLTFL